jgi:hypothetical protein
VNTNILSKAERNRLLDRSGCKLKDNIETECEGVDWINPA